MGDVRLHQETPVQIAIKYIEITAAAILGALSVVIFLIPADLIPTGITGVAVLLQELFGLPVGVMTILMNIPILYIGYRMLPGGWRVTVRTVYAVLVLSIAIDVLSYYFPAGGYTDDRFLNALFGGILGGVAGGLLYRTGTNFGGTSTFALILQRRQGLPISSTILYTDTAIIAAAGLVYNIEAALYALVVLFLGGIAADYVMEGPSVIRTASVVTDEPDAIADAVMERLGRGVTRLAAHGMYSKQDRCMLYITVSRSQVNDLRHIITDIDPHAFVVIGQGQTAYGQGFKMTPKQREVKIMRAAGD